MVLGPAFQTALYIKGSSSHEVCPATSLFACWYAYTFFPMKPRLASSLYRCFLKPFGTLHHNEKFKMVSVSRHAMLNEVADIISTSCIPTSSKLLKRYEKIGKPAVVREAKVSSFLSQEI
ncbi:unnamed protein product [Aspergillus oryzae RIB40]|uniref:DNA, SC020 n=1 Tax=Aspergillus oryzae (strain ATCC 42149 / RIB 40) TaxID=510516 RepID=Q2U3V8_ASPOR|nr:unnamed protein product [Aspergillus oryzae RIB40]BAE63757.1 unnamed protein product [Aspergillus oryzae RIB40]